LVPECLCSLPEGQRRFCHVSTLKRAAPMGWLSFITRGGEHVSWLKRIFNRPRGEMVSRVLLITDHGSWFRTWDGSLYKSDIVRAAIRPKAKAIGKLTAMHIRETAGQLQINPEPYLRMLLEEPNPYSGGQMFRERLATLLQLNNNAFVQI